MNWYLKVLKNYKDFNGRSRRQEYWMFLLFNLLFGFVAATLDRLLGMTINGLLYGPLYLVYGLIVFIPGLAVAIRRLHDTGKSAWYLLVALIPLLGAIWLIVLMATDGTPGENEYGVNPKEIS
ncbi:MAG: DUF805 domain-containing protein [Flavobacteriaceae bacterium]